MKNLVELTDENGNPLFIDPDIIHGIRDKSNGGCYLTVESNGTWQGRSFVSQMCSLTTAEAKKALESKEGE